MLAPAIQHDLAVVFADERVIGGQRVPLAKFVADFHALYLSVATRAFKLTPQERYFWMSDAMAAGLVACDDTQSPGDNAGWYAKPGSAAYATLTACTKQLAAASGNILKKGAPVG